MKIYGYAGSGFEDKDAGPIALREATLVASPDELRSIASFLISAALCMEQMGPAYSHEHLADKHPEFESSPEFVVFNPYSGELGATRP